MGTTHNGVASYQDARACVDIYFPEGHVACKYCRLFCRYEEAFKRYSCRLTDEWLLDPQKSIGDLCPLDFSEV